MAGKLDDFLNFNQNALNLRAQRQQLLASNIANADTPNYKARDINFAATLQSKLKQTQSSSVPATPSVDLARTSPMQSDNQAQYRTVDQPSADGNTVDMDVERVQYADNGLHYEADVTATSGQIKGLLSVIQGQ
jgi:flagellar basal-body rod protein FlgB